jgi:hypothetical protein
MYNIFMKKIFGIIVLAFFAIPSLVFGQAGGNQFWFESPFSVELAQNCLGISVQGVLGGQQIQNYNPSSNLLRMNVERIVPVTPGVTTQEESYTGYIPLNIDYAFDSTINVGFLPNSETEYIVKFFATPVTGTGQVTEYEIPFNGGQNQVSFTPDCAPDQNNGSTGSGAGGGSSSINVTIENPLDGTVSSIPDFIEKILDIVITIGVPIVALAIIYSGFLFVAAQGKPEGLQKARQAFTFTIIGAVLILAAWLIAQAIGETVNEFVSFISKYYA